MELDHGSVVERGTHRDLLDHRGLYRQLFDSQNLAIRED